MANIATTNYKVTGTRKAVNDLWSTLQKMEVNSKNILLYQLAEHYGIDYETKQISVRGHIYWAEYEEDPANDYYLLSFETETAWDACNELFEEIYPLRQKLHGMLAMSYSRRLTICYGMNSLSLTESVNVAVRSIMYMMKVTSSLKR